jgi:hypothetical protein
MALYLETLGARGLSTCLGVKRVAIVSAARGQPLSSRSAAVIRARISQQSG